jgi:hypothetical protein
VVRGFSSHCPAISWVVARTYKIREASLESLEVEKERLVGLDDLLKIFQFDRY